MQLYQKRIESARQAIHNSEFILVGGGAGLSAAAGLDYSGKRFTDHFADFIEKYGVGDMYSASFYPFETQEEFWAQWARHIDVNRFSQGPTQLYKNLLRLVQNKQYFVITTNVESQFEKAGFPQKQIFEVQGNYAYNQCATGCHNTLYYNEPIVKQMLVETQDCRIPAALVPHCPVCGGAMDVNLRHNQYFVQDQAWYQSQEKYESFLKTAEGRQITLLELGVGFNTPGIIRYPFEQITYQNPKAILIRINRDYPSGAQENRQRTISFNEDMGEILNQLLVIEHA